MTTTVKQLIAKLSKCPENAKVVLLNEKTPPESYVDSVCEFNVSKKLSDEEKEELLSEMKENNALNMIDEEDVKQNKVVYLMFG